MNTRNPLVLGLAAAAILSLGLFLQGCKPEHPEHPKAAAQDDKPSLDGLEKWIIDAVDKRKDKDGKIKIEDDVEKKDLLTTFVKVHKERLSEVEPGLFFACNDFKTDDGTIYDVDFWMKWTGGKGFEFSKLKVHKVSGKPRYSWEEKDGKWGMVPVPAENPPSETNGPTDTAKKEARPDIVAVRDFHDPMEGLKQVASLPEEFYGKWRSTGSGGGMNGMGDGKPVDEMIVITKANQIETYKAGTLVSTVPFRIGRGHSIFSGGDDWLIFRGGSDTEVISLHGADGLGLSENHPDGFAWSYERVR